MGDVNMDDYPPPLSPQPPRSSAGVISKIRLENFMCHTSLQIELGDWVNFITGQNGSGKSAILTALCIAFGCRARGTQRAATLRDFIKTGCSSAVVHVEIKNQGDDAFKPDIYGDTIIIERRISESTSTTVLKDQQGKRVATRKEELRELVEHFNIDVENPCVIMSQDKSREFLHSGNNKEKFKFFFKATLLQQVNDLLLSIRAQLEDANAQVDELESSIKPVVKELNELQGKIKSMEQVEEISQQVQQLKKKLAWSWVYGVDKKLREHAARIEKFKERIPTCQQKIDQQLSMLEELKENLIQKKVQIATMMEKTSEVRRMKDELQQNFSLASKERQELKGEYSRKSTIIEKMVDRARKLEKQVNEIQEQHIKETQAEECEIEQNLKKLQDEVDAANINLRRLKEEENRIIEELSKEKSTMEEISAEIESNERKHREIHSQIRELRQHQTNKVTAFGGEKVIHLLRGIERHQRGFTTPPIGPIGAHVTLVDGDTWASSVEYSIGKMLNAFIVTNHNDARLLRSIATEARYKHLQIIVYDFSRPRLNIPSHMLPQTNHPTTFSVIHTENHTVANVLVDVATTERQVLVKDYESGKSVAFDRRIPNLKEVLTLEGYRMFLRNGVETVLPPNRRPISSRLCCSFDDQIKTLENDASVMEEVVRQCQGRKRAAEGYLRDLTGRHNSVKKRRGNAEVELMSKEQTLEDVKNSYAAEAQSSSASNVDELCQEIYKIQDEVKDKQVLLEKHQVRIKEAEVKCKDLKISFEKLCDSTSADIDAFEKAEQELMQIEKDLRDAEAKKSYYEGVMHSKVLADIQKEEAQYQSLQVERQENSKKASIICSESEVEALGGSSGSTPEQLSAQLNKLDQRLQQESQRHSESIDDLRAMHQKKERKILRKQQTYEAFREKLNACEKALELRWTKLQRNASLLKRQLTWQFNGHLRKKGISGQIKVSYEEKTLSVEVKMPQDASSNTVRDTRGLSGGERSYSTLCFALALHDMTEAPFRAMDEFDVFMDAVSRKISLDTLVDFATAQGSQWIFITPHDISMVKPGERVKKQQMAAPRS